jgi:hypothetical protein
VTPRSVPNPVANTAIFAVAATDAAQPTLTPLLAALDALWARVRLLHPDVPHVILTVATGQDGMRPVTKWGHFWRDRWITGAAPNAETPRPRAPEVMLAGERLRDGTEAAVETVLHEAAHALNYAREVEDTSRQGRFHNRKFKAAAEELGLTCEKSTKFGVVTVLPLTPAVLDAYAAEIELVRRALATYRVPALKIAPDRVKATLLCACGPLVNGEAKTMGRWLEAPPKPAELTALIADRIVLPTRVCCTVCDHTAVLLHADEVDDYTFDEEEEEE